MKKAIIVVSFGTKYFEDSVKTIGAVEKLFKDRFTDYDIYRAYTSRVVKNKLQERGIHIDNVAEALERTKEYDEVVLQATHIIQGFEYDRLKLETDGYRLGLPLLSYDEDYIRLADILKTEYPYEEDTCCLFVAHGTEHRANSSYQRLSEYLREDMFIHTIEGASNGREFLTKIDKYSRVRLIPLLLVCGEHTSSDIFGQKKDSVKSMLMDCGKTVIDIQKALGEYSAVREIYVDHLKKIIE
jgi:sirohydrochlorin cobaltochelatase